jgi:hypothetical protein
MIWHFRKIGEPKREIFPKTIWYSFFIGHLNHCCEHNDKEKFK